MEKANKKYTYKGETHSLVEWAGIKNLSYPTLWTRLKRGWPLGRALDTPAKGYRRWVFMSGNETLSLTALSKKTGIPYHTLRSRAVKKEREKGSEETFPLSDN